MKLLVYEHVSGGGYAEKPIPVSILSEGFSMLRTLVVDFKAAGHSVSTVLDSRLAALNPPISADYTVPVSSFRAAERTIQKLSESVDATYLIAPESNQVLQSLVASMEQAGVPSLNCRANAIGNVSDKAAMLQCVKERELSTPATVIVSAVADVAEIKQTICGSLGFPLVVKPVDGVGCAGLSIVNSEQQVVDAVAKAISESSSKYFMAQELIHGVAVSVSLLATDSDVLPVSLNKQDVSLMPPEATSAYNGGQVPFDSRLKRETFAAAEAVVKSFHGLRGYVGVDLVLTEKRPVVIEVNPRLTTSYVGLRKIAGFNLAQAIINAVFENELPADNQSRGYAVFSKINVPKPTAVALQQTYGVSGVVSPPFPVPDNDAACALVLSHDATLKEATAGFHEAKKRLRSIMRSEGN
ncbi:ATP-grasp domain-containing protein [Candidatus Bathyarchaeota archaeon]|nr:ATP-grasp domain-containing protein [Candidatus Bathyarchaeota archaeon]